MKIKLGLEAEYKEYVELNSKDPYSNGVVTYTERWAALMEAAIDRGEKIKDFADKMRHEADTEGVTGFMHGCAMLALAHFWEHGEALRLWHNIRTQIGNEGERANETGGVLNPAILNVGLKE